MAIAHEDSVMGSAGISGDPTPVSPRSLPHQRADLSRQINHRPTPASKQAGAQQAMKGAPKEDKKKSDPSAEKPDSSRQSASEAQPQDTPAPPLPQGNPILPIDWKAKQAADPWTVHQHGQHVNSLLTSFLTSKPPTTEQEISAAGDALNYTGAVYNAAADPHAIGQSVKNIWDSNTAQGEVAKWVMEAAIQVLPPAALAKSIDQQVLGASDKTATADVLGQGLAMTANPLNLAAPERALVQAAVFAGPSVIAALNAKNANDQSSQLLWAGVTAGLLSMGHLGAFKGVLSDALGRWPELEKTIDAIVQGRKDAQTRIQDPLQDHRLDWIHEALKNPVFAGGAATKKADAAKEGERVLKETRDPVTGEIRQIDQTKEATKAALKAVGVEDRVALEQKVVEGRLGPASAKAIIDNWTAMGFKYDLNVVTKADSPLRDPLLVVRAMPAEAQAKGVRALTAAHGYIEQMARGHFVNDASPLASTWRSLVGHSRGTDAIDREGAAAMLDLGGHIDGNLLSKAIEGDRATYDALEPAGKAYVDIWRLLSNEERLARQRAGIPFAVGDYLWRVTKRPANAARGAGGSGILTSEAEKHRTLAPTIVSKLPEDPPHRAISPTSSPSGIASDLNSRALYHGSPEVGIPESSLSLSQSNPASLLGPGLYMTDHPSIAASYGKKAGTAGAVYRAATSFKSVLHAEAPLPTQVRKSLVDALGKDHFGEQIVDFLGDLPKDASYLDFVKAVKSEFSTLSHQDNIPAYEFQESMLTLNQVLRDAGYDAATHTGGIKGGPPHTVAVALDPGKELHSAPSGVGSWGDAAESRIVLTQAHETVADANAAVARAREGALGHLTDWATPLSKEFVTDPEAQAIRKLAQTDVAAAEQRARDYTAAIFRDFETNSHRILARGGFGRQIKAIQTQKAISDLVDMKLTVPNPDKKGANIVVNAAYRIGQDPRVDSLMRDAGYQQLQQGHFRDVLVHPDLAKLIDRGTRHGAYDAKRPAALKAALEVEGLALRLIMYQPAVHGWNVAGRFLAFAGMHAASDPVGLVTHLFGGGDAAALKQEAINAGVVNHGKYANFLPELYKQMGDALGEHDLFDVPLDAAQVTGHSSEVADLAGLGKPKMNFLERAQNLLWTKVDDFATAAYHIEKHSALASGMSPEQAGLYAARRANSWAGYVAAEDTNPLYHDAARLLMFAPSFWRTWAEIFVPLYKNSGVAVDSTVLKHMAKQEMALAASTVGVAYVTGNLLNVMASGQMQDHNAPQNRMKIEVRRPEFIRALQAAHYPGAAKIDPTTGHGPNGEVLSLDNPLGRFQKDVAGAAGLTSGHPDYKPEDTEAGLEQFLMNRSSPFLGAAAAFGNTDLYQTIKDGNWRAVDPSSPGGRPTPESTLLALLYMTPNGSSLIHQITSSQNKATDMTLPGGAKIPAGVMKVAEALPPTLQGLAWQAMTGTTGPYTTTERTRGQTPSDDEYRKYAEIKTSYETKLGLLDSEMAGGSKTPSQWLSEYRKEHGTYIDQTGAFFMHAPEYAHGPTALTAEWEKLYTKAENPDGSLDPSALAGLQAEWKAKHTPADYRAVQGQLSKSDRKYPMVGLYHKTIAAYTKWQEDWAQKNGVDVNQLRADVRAYGAAYGDSVKTSQILRTHREVALYERAKKTEFEHSPAGLVYGLYYSSATVANYMRAYHLTAQQVIAEEQAAP